MMSTMALSSPETGTSPPAIRHAFTSPSKWIEHQQIPTPTRQTDGKTVETLYTHRAAKIVSFSPISSSPRLTSSSSARRVSADHEDEAVGTLPWASSTERTIAAGMLCMSLLGAVYTLILLRATFDLPSSRISGFSRFR